MEKKNIWIGAISAMFAVHLIGCTGLMNVHVAILAVLHGVLGLVFGFLANFYYAEEKNFWVLVNSFLLIIITVVGFNKDSPLVIDLGGYSHLAGVLVLSLFYIVGHYIDKKKLLRA